MQTTTSVAFVPWLEILGESGLPRVSKIVKRVEKLAQRSNCPILKVAYSLVTPELEEISFAVNKHKRYGNKHENHENEPPNWMHAEWELTLKIRNSNKKITECCAIGNFSPCRYCVMDLKSINVGAIIFSNLYWDTPALQIAEEMGIKLFYFSNSRLHVLTQPIISDLSNLKIVPIRTRFFGNENLELNALDVEEKTEYVRIHKAALKNLLNDLMVEILSNNRVKGDARKKVRISKLLSQIDTEQEYFRWAKRNVFLTKQPW